jgi:hypothetical protein
MKLFVQSIASILVLVSLSVKGQNQGSGGEIHGNFQLDAQFYRPDSSIGAAVSPERLSNNAFSNIIYTNQNFSAGLRFESYLNTLQGFSPQYNGTGIPYRFASFKNELLKVTVGNFYEQFGSGTILRTYEERGLGYDNAFEGINIQATPTAGVYIKALVGKQRKYFVKGQGIVRGLDAEVFLNEVFDSSFKKINVSIGGSVVSKYQEDVSSVYVLPENVASFGGRMAIFNDRFRLSSEYTYKMNDPSTNNNYIYKPGEALLVQFSYFESGLGFSLDLKRVDNMSYRSERDAVLSDVLINYIPAYNRQHTYNLMATIYPYAVQLNGEIGGQAELSYNFKKNTLLGGKNGTKVLLNYSISHNLDTHQLNDLTTNRQGYSSTYLGFGEKYFSDFNIEIQKKLSNKLRSIFTYSNLAYNKDVIEGKLHYGLIYANIGIMDLSYKLSSKHNIRTELQGLFTKQDQGSWATALVEYTYSPHWFMAIMDQYNYGNPEDSKKLHYFIGSVGYMKDSHRISVNYGRQRAGIFCVGGVCRNVPAANGLSLSLSTVF